MERLLLTGSAVFLTKIKPGSPAVIPAKYHAARKAFKLFFAAALMTFAFLFPAAVQAQQITSVDGPLPGSYGLGQTLTFTVHYDAPVNVVTAGGTPYILVSKIGGTVIHIPYASGTGTADLVFQYTATVASSDPDDNGLHIQVNPIVLNGGTIKDASSGNDAELSFTAPDVSNVLIDVVGPTILSITADDPNPTSSETVNYTMTFSEYVPVDQITESVFSLVQTGTLNGYIMSITPVDATDLDQQGSTIAAATTYSVAVCGLTADGTVRLDVNDTGTGITDMAGNPIGGGFHTADVYTIQATGSGTLSALSVGLGTLYPGFDPAMLVYHASVPNGTTSIDITPTVSVATSTVTVNGITATSGSPLTVSLNPGDNLLPIIVTAQDASTTEYDLTVTVINPAPTISYPTPNALSAGVAANIAPTASNVDAPGYNAVPAIIGSGFTAPSGIARDSDGNIYVVDSAAGTVSKVAPDGTITVIGTGFSNPLGVAVDANKNVYVADTQNGQVKKIAASDGAITSIGSGFSSPTGVAVDKCNNIYVADSFAGMVVEISADLTQQVEIAPYSFVLPWGVAVDHNGNIYVADAGDGSIKEVPAGQDTATPMGSGGFTFAINVAVDQSNNVYAADFINNVIVRIYPDGTTQPVISGGISQPYGMVVDGAGKLYVASSGTWNVQEFTPSGGYFVSPALPKGLSIDNTTGVISGTPCAGTPATDYTVTAYSSGGPVTALVNISVVSNDATLACLTVSNGSLYPYFDPLFLSYRNAVPNNVSSITFTPKVNYPAATVKINGTAAVSGTASDPINLNEGDNTIYIEVTAEDGVTTLTDTITVTRLHAIPTVTYPTPLSYTLNVPVSPLTPGGAGAGAPGHSTTSVPLGSGLGGPVATAVDVAGNVYATDILGGAVIKVHRDGTAADTLANGLLGAFGVAVDATGAIYFTEIGTLSLKKIPASGGTPVIISTDFVQPMGVAVDANNNVYVTDFADDKIKVFANGGLGAETTISTHYDQPFGITVDKAGNIYYASQNKDRIRKVPIDGSPQVTVAGLNALAPTGVAIDDAGNIYESGLLDGKIKMKPADGSAVVCFPIFFGGPTGLASDAVGNLYIADALSPLVQEIPVMGGYFVAPTLPTGLSMDPATGTVSGTPTALSAAKDYTFSAYSDGGGATAVANIAVLSGNALLTKIVTNPNVKLSLVNGPDFKDYTSRVGFSTSSVTLTPVTNDLTSTIKINDVVVAANTPSAPISLDLGDNVINTVVTAQNGINTNTYSIKITRIAESALASLSVSPATTLHTVAGPDFKDYTATVLNSVNAITLTPSTPEISSVIKVNGVVVASGTASQSIPLVVGDNTIITTVTTGATTNTYSLVVTRQGPVLATIALSPNTTLKTVAGPDFKDYTAAVVNSVSSVTLTPTASDPSNVIKVNDVIVASGTASGSIALNEGDNTITTTVTDGTTTNTYSIKITRQAPAILASLTLNPATSLSQVSGPDFRDYTARVGNSISSVTVTPKTADPTNIIKVNDVVVVSGTASAAIPLVVGDNTITTIITDGVLTNTYSIKITRLAPAILTSITLDPRVTLATVAGPDFKDYTGTVSTTTTSVTVTPTTPDATNIIQVNGLAVASGTASGAIPLNVGDNIITTTVSDGATTNTYSIKLNRQPPAVLASIATNPNIKLKAVSGPDFADYTGSVVYSVALISIIPTAIAPSNTIKVNDIVVASGTASLAIPLNVGDNTIVTTVSDGSTTNTYSIKITRQASSVLASLTVDPSVTLSQVAGPDYRDYTGRVGNSVSSVTVTPKSSDPVDMIKVNGVVVASGTASGAIPLIVGDNIITTTVTGGLGTNTYSIKITRLAPAVLLTFTVNPNVALKTVAGPDFKDYTGTVDNSVTSVTITPATPDATNVIKVNDVVVASGSASAAIPLNVGDNTIATTVTDGTITNTYSLVITRLGMSITNLKYDGSQEMPVDPVDVVVHQNVSPNGDGNSDHLQIDGITAYPDNKLQIMSRSGELIYETKGYDNQTKIFDGHSTNGKLQQAGTYFYSLEYKTATDVKRKTGFIVIKY
ncbi:MAG TPA: cadherin-like beta sandwich domain-containing protein [Mucilaginibacter sp.]